MAAMLAMNSICIVTPCLVTDTCSPSIPRGPRAGLGWIGHAVGRLWQGGQMLSAPPPGETVAPSGPVRYRPAADPALRALVSVVWRTEVAPEGQTVRVLPDAAVDLVITADRIAVAGPDTGPSVERLPAGPVVG